MTPVETAMLSLGTDREKELYATAKTDKARGLILRAIDARVAKAPTVEPVVAPSGAIAVILPAKGAKPHKPLVKPTNGVTKAPTAEPAKVTDKPVPPTVSLPPSAPTKVATVVVAPTVIGVGCALTGMSELFPVKILSAVETKGKGGEIATTYTVDVVGAPEGIDPVSIDQCVNRDPLSTIVQDANGAIIGGETVRLTGMTMPFDGVFIPVKGMNLAKVAVALNAVIQTPWVPLATLPVVGAHVSFYDPTSGGSGPGAKRPVHGTVTAVTGNDVILTGDGWKDSVTVVGALGVLYDRPAVVVGGTPMFALAWANQWKARTSLRSALYQTHDAEAMNAIEVTAVKGAKVWCAPGCEGLTF